MAKLQRIVRDKTRKHNMQKCQFFLILGVGIAIGSLCTIFMTQMSIPNEATIITAIKNGASSSASSSSRTTRPQTVSKQNKETAMDEPNDDNKPRTITWSDWPATAYEEVGHPLVFKGDSFFNHARALYFDNNDKNNKNGGTSAPETLMDEFVQVYKNRPDPVNMCGIRINHALALFLAVKYLQPTTVVESGVNAGVSTYFIRTASPTTRILAIDPLEQPICGQGQRWVDSSTNQTINLTGKKSFVDLLDLDWKGMVERNEIDLNKTLVFIDDHLHAFQRIAGVMKHGIRHVIVEDNYKLRKGATYQDKRSTPKQIFLYKGFDAEAKWLFRNIVAYSEFPPLVPPIMARAYPGEKKKEGGFLMPSDSNHDIVHPILRPDLNTADLQIYQTIARTLGFDPTLRDQESYMQFMNYNQICYLELIPTPPMLLGI